MKTIILSFATHLLFISLLSAEVVTDGSLGTKVDLPGPNFQIEAKLGQQHGGNLFHSFQEFNLQSHESATFSGPNSVQNVISRVTGGNPSTIDGLIRSTIPNADLYFLNPYGILFGPNAQLDVQGGFHASTADYLRFSDGERFDTRTPNNSLLTVAPIAAFGFLTDSPATITAQNSRLSVPPMRPLSFIAGHLNLQGAFPVQFDDLNIYAMFATSLLKTTGGQLSLAAVGSSGEVLWNDDLTMTSLGGDLTLNNTLIDTSSLGSGNLKIRGGRLLMQNSILQANTLGDFDGGITDIQLTESLYAESERYFFLTISSRTLLGRGQGGHTFIKVPEFTLKRSVLGMETLSVGNAGNLNLEVARLNLLEGAGLTAAQGLGTGKGGRITINASESVLISGFSVGTYSFDRLTFTDMPAFIDNSTYSPVVGNLGGGETHITTQRLDLAGGVITNASLGNGDAGNITIQADNINITEGGFITTTVMGTGLAGNIQLDVKDTLFMSGRRPGAFVTPVTGLRLENSQSNISSFSLSGSGGQIEVLAKTIHATNEAFIGASSLGLGEKASHINLQAAHLLLTAGGQINSSNGFYAGTTFLLGTGSGSGGDIRIQTRQLTLIGQPQSLQTGIFSDTYNQGPGGNLFVETASLDINQGATISARSHDIGDAGQINLQTQHLHLSQHGSISTAATQSGGGNITLNNSSGLLYLDNSEITTSVAAGQGSGGNITIEKPQFMVLNHAQIKAQADEGQGGNIRIVAEQFIPSADSLISASSQKGISGEVTITSPENSIGNNLIILGTESLKADQVKTLCGKQRASDKPSRFIVTPLAGNPPSPDDEWQTSSLK